VPLAQALMRSRRDASSVRGHLLVEGALEGSFTDVVVSIDFCLERRCRYQ